jgi:hypothetical protein
VDRVSGRARKAGQISLRTCWDVSNPIRSLKFRTGRPWTLGRWVEGCRTRRAPPSLDLGFTDHHSRSRTRVSPRLMIRQP